MAGLTLAQAQANLTAANDAYQKALQGQGYSMSSGTTARSFQRQSVDALLRQVQYWEGKVNILSGRRSRIKYGIAAPG
jgi:hypothetical protein